MNMTNEEYGNYIKGKEKEKSSPLGKNMAAAFVVGGLICVLGEALVHLFGRFGLDTEDAGAAASVSLIFLSAVLTGLGIYDKIAKFAGAGTLVPITGFANSIVSPAMEFKSEGYILGMSAKLFTIAGPVLVFGISASILYGILLRLFS
jgi:stage V sporulation protein AC